MILNDIAIIPSVRPAVTPQKFSVMTPSQESRMTQMVSAARNENPVAVAALSQVLPGNNRVRATAGSNPPKVMGRAAAARPMPRGSEGGSGARSLMDTAIPLCLPIC
ncbi:Uncharacterised protein [Mycobacteroides abscessus subsp. massiliense]|nr:Uncharacterised protein [Mycobacteroides abscessus subsp. massiliense]